MPLAFTRPVPPSIVRCELTHLERVPIDVARAAAQHAAYEAALRSAGCEVRHLPAAPDLPDSVFVEDTAVVVDECAVIARPGAPSRRGETRSVAEALHALRELYAIEPPGTLDGGDVLRVGRQLFVGLSTRTNAEGVRQLRALLAPHGYSVSCAEVRDCLHLKTAATPLGDDLLLLDPQRVDGRAFGGVSWVEVAPDEPQAANVLAVGRTVICSDAAPQTRRLLEARGWRVLPLDVSELAKAEAGVTCCSLILEA